MGILLIILCVLVLLWAIDFRFSIKKHIVYNNMDKIYYEIENYIITNNISITPHIEKYIYNIKSLKRNKEITDIQVMIMLLRQTSQNDLNQQRNSVKRLEKNIPNELLEMGNKFYYEATRATKISRLKPRFIIFLIIKTTLVLTYNIIKRSFKNIVSYFNIIGKALNDTMIVEMILSSKQSKNFVNSDIVGLGNLSQRS